MYPSTVLTQYESLPEKYKKEANDFIEFLYSKANQKNKKKKTLKRNAFGSLKGLIHMADDFDEPLEAFKEYM
jgi:ABC-type glycerol-3-phosphate transport system substrate-binding protein